MRTSTFCGGQVEGSFQLRQVITMPEDSADAKKRESQGKRDKDKQRNKLTDVQAGRQID